MIFIKNNINHCFYFFILCPLFFLACGKRRPPFPRGNLIPSQKPYKIRGKTYYPIPSANGYRKVGIASWYGKNFHGRPTASGETYNMYKLSAAHTTLPLGSLVTVYNLENNRKVRLVINDRGPFVRGRIIDLSYHAAKKLGFLSKGTTKVMVVAEKSKKVKNMFLVQVAAFRKLKNAKKSFKKLFRKLDAIRIVYDKKSAFFKLRTGYFFSRVKAEKARKEALNAGFLDSFIISK